MNVVCAVLQTAFCAYRHKRKWWLVVFKSTSLGLSVAVTLIISLILIGVISIGSNLYSDKTIRRLLLIEYFHLAHIYFKHKGKKRLSEADQILFTVATNYLKGVMNGHTSLAVKAWKAEYAKLTAEHRTLNGRYLSLKDKVKEAEQIRKSVYSILRQEQREQASRKAQDIDK